MLIFEIVLTLLVVVGGGVALLGWLMRPLWRGLAHRWKIEGQAVRIRQGLEREQAERHREYRGRAAEEVAKWLNLPEAVSGAVPTGGMAASVDPVLQALLERHPLDDRVLELNRLYRQATGKDLLPARLLRAADPDAPGGQDGPNAPEAARPEGAATRPLTTRESAVVDEARREVEEWLGTAEASGGPRGQERRA